MPQLTEYRLIGPNTWPVQEYGLMSLVREPDAGNPHVRFHERHWKRSHGGE